MASAPAAEGAYGVPSTPSVGVAGDCFCVPYPVGLIVKKRLVGLWQAHFDVLDVNGSLLLQVDGGLSKLQKKRVLRDPAGFPILTMREKVLTLHHRWKVHRGESSDASNLLFTVQRSHSLQIRTELYVYLASNVNEGACDFHVSGPYPSQSFRVYKGNNLLAEVKGNFKLGSFICNGKESFEVKVYPGVDYAFIVSLLVILNENDIFM